MKRTTTIFLLLFLCTAALLTAQNSRMFLAIEPQGSAGQVLLVETGKDIQFSAKALEATAQGTMIEHQIDQMTWNVDPAGFGSISASGLFSPGDPNDPAFSPVGRIIATAVVGNMTLTAHVAARFNTGSGIGDYTFRGTVLDEQRRPVPHAHVSVMHAGMLPVLFDGMTNPNGVFEVRVPAGSYIVHAEAQGFIPEFFDDVTSRDKAQVFTTDPAKLTYDNIDFVLASGQNHFEYSYEGTVLDADGKPVEDALVSANSTISMQPFNYNTRTDASGTYRVAVPAGRYIISAAAKGFITEFYDNVRDAGQATELITDAANKTVTGIDFGLSPGGRITGIVMRADAAASPLPGATVTVLPISNNPNIPPTGAGWTTVTDKNGVYAVDGLPSGEYMAMAHARGYLPLFYDGAKDPSTASKVSVTEGSVTSGINFLLEEEPDLTPRNRITGMVKDADGNPAINASVRAEATDPSIPHFYARIDRNGEYEIPVPDGTYRVRAEAPGHAAEYFDNVYDASAATLVTLDSTQRNRDHVDFALGHGGTISGTVLRASDQSPLTYARVMVVGPNGGGIVHPNGTAGTVTDDQGRYTISGLGTGEYIVTAMHDGYVQLYYDDVEDVTLASKVSVVVDQETSGIDFAMNALPGVSGTVTDETTQQPLADAIVIADGGSGKPGMTALTQPDGRYHLALPPGDYVIRAMSGGYLGEFYDDVTDRSLATTVTVVAGGADITGIDFALSEGGVITGVVSNAADNAPMEGVFVTVAGPNGTPGGAANGSGARTDVNGVYRITGLPTGSFKVVAHADGFQPQYFDMASDIANATDVQVTVNQTTSGIDFALSALPGIAGRVTNADNGDPIPHAEIMAEGPGIRPFFAYTDANGNYHLPLPEGTYKVAASAQGFVFEWFDNQSDRTLAEDVVVQAGVNRSDVDFALDGLGTGAIAGTVTSGTGAGIANARVFALASPGTANGPGYHGNTVTKQDGSYEITGLPAGSYVVVVHAQGYLREFFDDATDFASATPVQVVKDQAATGIDFELGEGGHISGTVTDEDSGDPLSDAFVHIRKTNSGHEFGTRTDHLGQYEIAGLPTGTYMVYAAAPHHAGEFFDDAATAASATPVSVTAPGTTSGIDFALATAPRGPKRFNGTVTLHGGGSNAPMLTLVEAVHPQTGDIVRTTTTRQGAFELEAWDEAVIRARAIGYVGTYAGGTYEWQKSRWNGFAGGMNIALDPVAESGPFTVTGVTSDINTGKGISNAWVYGIDAAGAVRFAVSSEDGTFSLPSSGEECDLLVSAVGYEVHTSALDGAPGGNLDLRLSPTGVTGAEQPALPVTIALEQNFPNPFNPSTSIRFALPSRSHASITVYNLLGAKVATLLDGMVDAGEHAVRWDASEMTSGVYLYRLQAGARTITRRMVLSK